MRTARQVQAFGKASRREIPLRIVRSRWNHRGLVERAVEADLAEAGLPLMRQHLSDLSEFGKLTLSGRVPVTGKAGDQAKKLIDEIKALGAVPSKRKVAA